MVCKIDNQSDVKPVDNQCLASPVVDVLRGGLEIIDSIADEWRYLCEEGSGNEPYYRPEWVSAYVRAFAPSRILLLFIVRIENRIKLILPLLEEKTYISGFPVMKLRSLAESLLGRTDIVRVNGWEGDSAVVALWDHLKAMRYWDVLEMRLMPRGGQGEALLQLAVRDGFTVHREGNYRTPFISLSTIKRDEEPFRSARSSNLRQTLSKAFRKVEAEGGYVLHCYRKADPELLQTFYDMEHSGWKVGSSITAIGDPSWRMFCDDIARGGDQFGYLALYFLEFKGQIAAVHFGFVCGGRYYFYKVAVNQDLSAYSMGHLSVNAVLKDCVNRGLTEFDFTGYVDDWKLKWTEEIRHYDNCSVYRNSLYGSMLNALKYSGSPIMRGPQEILRFVRKLIGSR